MGESVALYSFACVLLPSIYLSLDPTLWQVVPNMPQRSFPTLRAFGSQGPPLGEAREERLEEQENRRKSQTKRRRIGSR